MERIAVPYANGAIDQHFGHAPVFKLYDAENGEVTATELFSDPDEGHRHKLAAMQEKGVSTVICGGIGMPAIEGMQKVGIEVYTSNKGQADEVVSLYLKGELPHVVEGHTHGPGGCRHDH